MITSSYNYSDIINRILQRIPSTIDKREGSISYIATAAVAMELAKIYLMLQSIENEAFPDTASLTYLKKHAVLKNLYPYTATYAVVRGEFNIPIDEDTRFNLIDSSLNYTVTSSATAWDGDDVTKYYYLLMCETIGSVGNQTGELIPMVEIDGLTDAKITNIATYGTDDESVENFRTRYFDNITNPSFAGNRAAYKNAIANIDGVGGCKLIRAANGGGTVGIIICDADYGTPTNELIEEVQTEIDPIVNSGEGYGLAPIGHRVTVSGVEATAIEVSADFEYEDGYTWNSIYDSFMSAVSEYFDELNKTWADNDSLVIRIAQIENRLLNIDHVIDVQNVTLYPEDEESTTKNFIIKNNKIIANGTTEWVRLSNVTGCIAAYASDPAGTGGKCVKFEIGAGKEHNGWSFDIARLIDDLPSLTDATGILTVSFKLYRPSDYLGNSNFFMDLSGNTSVPNEGGGNTTTYGRLSSYDQDADNLKFIAGSAATNATSGEVTEANTRVLDEWATVTFTVDFGTRTNFVATYKGIDYTAMGFPSDVDDTHLYLNIRLSDKSSHTNSIIAYVKDVAATYAIS